MGGELVGGVQVTCCWEGWLRQGRSGRRGRRRSQGGVPDRLFPRWPSRLGVAHWMSPRRFSQGCRRDRRFRPVGLGYSSWERPRPRRPMGANAARWCSWLACVVACLHDGVPSSAWLTCCFGQLGLATRPGNAGALAGQWGQMRRGDLAGCVQVTCCLEGRLRPGRSCRRGGRRSQGGVVAWGCTGGGVVLPPVGWKVR